MPDPPGFAIAPGSIPPGLDRAARAVIVAPIPTGGAMDLSSLFFLVVAAMLLQPVLSARVFAARRVQAIRRIERKRASRVITMIHRQEQQRILGMRINRQIGLEDAQTIIAAIKETPRDMPIDVILHTPGGLVLAAMQIARALEAHPARVTVHVPIYAMSGGTLIALAADEVVMGEFSMLGPIDPQVMGLPGASIVKLLEAKGAEGISDIGFVLADVSEKAMAQMRRGATELLTPRMALDKAEALAEKLVCGTWTHDYALMADEARELGLPVREGIARDVLDLMKLYPQPVKTTAVEVLPIDRPDKPLG